MKILTVYIIVIIAAVGLGFWLFKTSEVAQEDLPGTFYESQGQAHIDEGSTNHPAYNSNPPTSGWHWPRPAPWGSYNTTQPDERLIHNLEHGGIWISYKPGKVEADTVSKIQDFAKRYRKIIVEPREANDASISLAAWAWLQNLDEYDENAILRFIEAHYDMAPEKAD